VVAGSPGMVPDGARPSSYILLITDGEPNCAVPETATEPAYTVGEIGKAAMMGYKTFVIGFGQLPATAQNAMNMMAEAGGAPCTSTSCGTKKYYAAESDAALNAAIDAISLQIVGEVGGLCDDSCYANACPNAGEVCVQGQCEPNPCGAITCPEGDFCYTDGSSAGVCIHACPGPCPRGQTCVMGNCQADPCATASCVAGQVCVNGACVTDPCGTKSCDSHYLCLNGECVDDPCQYITCPPLTACQAGTGQCVGMAMNTTGGTTGTVRATSGCSYGGWGAKGPALAPLALFILALLSRRRRRV
jgi:uncharacterized protein (TIGR03382 family)